MQTVDRLIEAAWVIPIHPSNTCLPAHSVAINHTQIVDILPTTQAQQKYQAHSHTILNQHVLMPGLINCHTHTPMNLLRGLADDLKLQDWLQHYIWPAEKAIINEDSVKIGSTLAIMEMIQSGTTCFSDHYPFGAATEDVAIKTGIRACIGQQIMDQPIANWANNAQGAIDRAELFLQNTTNHPLISYSLAPHAIYSIDRAALVNLHKLAQRFNIPMHLHLHETQAEIDNHIATYQCSPIQTLHELGMLSAQLQAVHCAHLSDHDIALLKANQTPVIHCPKSNLKLASGFAPINKLIDAGINIALGTDGAASNNDLDMFLEMQMASLLAKGHSGNAACLPAHAALEMATINGAKTLGLDHKIGSLEIGKEADIIAVNLHHNHMQPVYHPISNLVYSPSLNKVTDVWIAGQQVLDNEKLTTITPKNIQAKLKEYIAKIKDIDSTLKPAELQANYSL